MIEENSVEALLAEMVRIDSSNPAMGGPADGQAVLGKFLESVVTRWRLASRRQWLDDTLFNLIVWHEVDPDRPWLIFDSHLDTVSTANMSETPLDPVVRDGRMYGRGTCDTKSSGAAMLVALHRYSIEYGRNQPGNNVLVTFTCDEEVAKTGIHALVDKDFAIFPGGRPAAAIVGEPTLLRPVIAHAGVVRWSVVTAGKAAHSSNPANGDSAISKMVKIIGAIESEYIPSLTATHPLVGHACCSINEINGGTAINIIPDRCEIRIDRRFVPGEDASAIMPAVERIFDRLRSQDATLRVTQELQMLDPSLDDACSGQFTRFTREILKGQQLDDTPQGARYCTNASQFAIGGVPTIVLGPGDIAQAHTANEWIELSQVYAAANVYLAMMTTPLPAGGRGEQDPGHSH